jgi:hypothetical protein
VFDTRRVGFAELTLEMWSGLDEWQARRIAAALADRHGLDGAEVARVSFGDQTGRCALFSRDGMRFALVPGGAAILGCDPDRFKPSADQADDYAESAAEYGLPGLPEFLAASTSPPRATHLPAMLVGLDPYAAPSLRAAPGALAAYGLRVATPDEWEYACGAGARTLFRWGDETPGDGYPGDYPAGPHRLPNLFGLRIGQDPYRIEHTTDPAVRCGGDGGAAEADRRGFFLGWLTLATAYRMRAPSRRHAARDILVRAVLPLS